MKRMRQAIVKYNNIQAGLLTEEDNGGYLFVYDEQYFKNYPRQFITFQMPVGGRKHAHRGLWVAGERSVAVWSDFRRRTYAHR